MKDSILPLDFHLADASGEPVLLLGGAMDLTLGIWNTSPDSLFLSPLTQQVYHFTLRFPAGVLRKKQTKIEVSHAAMKEWDVSTTDENGDVLLHLRHKQGGEWLAEKPLKVKLKALHGARARGTRAARIELAYNQIHYGSAEGRVLDGQKYHQLLLSTTQAHPALEAQFVGDTGNVVLNDGKLHDDYTLKLRLTNTTPDVLTVTPETTFHVTFAGGPRSVPGMLATLEQLNDYLLTAHIQTLERPDPSLLQIKKPADDEWTIHKPESQSDDIAITPDGYLEIEIGHILTGHPNGSSNVRVVWSNLEHPHGTQDGEVVARLQKSPLVIVGNMVGIGTIPRMQLDSKMVREVKDEADYALRGVVGSSVKISYKTASYPPCLDWPCIRWDQNTKLYWPGAGVVELPNFWDRSVEKPLRDLLKDWRGLQSYLDLLNQTGWSMSNQSFMIPLLPNRSLYTELGSSGLFFDPSPDQGWWREKAVFLARWDAAGVAVVDGSIHPCPLQKA